MTEQFIVICQSAWMNESGYGINYGWDGERFDTLKEAIEHGWEVRDSDDFNIGHVDGDRLTWFGWMDEKIDEPDDDMALIADDTGLTYAPLTQPL